MSAFSHGFKHGFMHGMFNNMFGGGWCNPFMNGFGMGFNPFGGYYNPFNNFGFGCNPYMSWNPASLFIMPRYDYGCYIPYQSPSMPLQVLAKTHALAQLGYNIYEADRELIPPKCNSTTHSVSNA